MQLAVKTNENRDLVLSIPEEYLRGTKLINQKAVSIHVKDGDLIIQHINKPKPKSLRELFEGYDKEVEWEEWNTGSPVGEEVF